MSSAASLSMVAAVSSVVNDSVRRGIAVSANAVTACVATGVTTVASMNESPVNNNVLFAASVSLAAAMTSVVGDDIASGVVVGAHVSPVATNTPSAASQSFAAAVWSAVGNNVAIATGIACAAVSASFFVVRQVTHTICTVSDLVLRQFATVK